MDQRGFAKAFLPVGFSRNARLERIAALIDWLPVEALVRRARPGTDGSSAVQGAGDGAGLAAAAIVRPVGPRTGEALSGRVSFRRFCGLALEAAGFMVKAGTLIDASLVEAAVRRPADGSSPRGQESRSPHDPDANWTRTARGTRRFFGYKIHVGIDQGSGTRGRA